MLLVWWRNLTNRKSQNSLLSRSRNLRRSSSFRPQVERLEERALMSHAGFPAASPTYILLNGGQRSSGLAGEHRAGPGSGATPAGYSSPEDYTPAQVRHAYGFDQISF
jgi:hypothetical protein